MIDTVEVKQRVDLRALAGRYTQLRKAAGERELEGPCPKCGGTDRLHVQSGWWFCRGCYPLDNGQPHDAIAFVRWLNPGLSFAEAVAQLAGGQVLPASALRVAPAPARRREKQQPVSWRAEAEQEVERAHAALWRAEGEPAQQYLERRGLEPATWLAFKLGYAPAAALPGTEGERRAPAVLMPWYRGGRLVGIRYRYLQAQRYRDKDGKEREIKAASKGGSQFANEQGAYLFGAQAHEVYGWLAKWPVMPPAPEGYRPAEYLRTLVLTEGEINAASLWQVSQGTRLDVLSYGSESATRLSPAQVALAGSYGTVIIWADRLKVAREIVEQIPGAHAIESPIGKDANDLLGAGALGKFLALARLMACHGQEEREALLWALYDQAASLRGVDGGTAEIIGRLSGELGKRAEVAELEPGRWCAV